MASGLRRAAKGLLSVNLAFLIRAARAGLADAVEALHASYDRMQPFGPLTRYRLMYDRSVLRLLAARYCRGRGVEIGPGVDPYGDPRLTILLDKFAPPTGSRVKIDLRAEASELACPDGAFDYLVSAHCLEHVPDTLRALYEWKRVLKPGGIMILILPHADRTYDRARTRATLAHHLEDYAARVGGDDPAHWREFEEITVPAAEHFWLRDPRCRCPDGTLDRAWVVARGYVHYHAWTQDALVEVLRYVGLEIVTVLEEVPDRADSFLVIGRAC